MANSIEVLSEGTLSAVVGAVNADRLLRERTGMCGCGVLPDPGTLHVH